MSNTPNASLALAASPEVEAQRRLTIGSFFRSERLKSDLSPEKIAEALDLESTTVLFAYESGKLAIPVDDIFALTNLLNIPPEDVMELVHELYLFGAD